MTRAKDISKILTDANISGTLDVSGAFTSQGIDDNADATAITIDSSERVGIGASPTQLLDVVGSSANIRVAESGGGDLRMNVSGSTGGIGTHSNHPLIFRTNSGEQARIHPSGHFFINTSAPDVTSALVVSGNQNADVATFMYNGNSGTFFDINCETANGSIILTADARSGNYPPLTFKTGNAERVRISSDGVTSFATTNTNPAENNVTGTSILATGAISASADGNFGLQVNRKSSFGGVIHLRKDGAGKGFIAIFEDSSSGRLLLGNDNTCLLFNDSAKQIIPFQSTGAKQDDIISLGNASGRFDQVFCANSNLNTSDRNEKQDIEELSDAEKRVAVRCKGLIRKYRWKKRVAEKGDNARIHVGLIAQDLQDAFTAEGLDATKYSMFCSDTYWDNDEVYVDDDGVSHNIVKSYYTEEEAPDGATKKTRLGVRYDEIFAFIISTL